MSEEVREPFAFVIFGATGDLARRKLIPAVYHLATLGYLPANYAMVGTSRTDMSDDAFREMAKEAIQEHGRVEDEGALNDTNRFLPFVYYQKGDTTKPEDIAALKARLDALDAQRGLKGNRLFYLAVAPNLVPDIIKNLHAADMLHESNHSWVRVVFEKPFGNDLESARELNDEIKRVLHEKQIFRIDHYLGKESVQNILTFRFGNTIFEPIFNRAYVNSIRITVAETIGMEGKRGAYYDTAGALRDVVQNHVLQLISLIMMEPPSGFEPESIRDEKVKVLRSLQTMNVKQVAASTVRGQYRGYRNEEGVNPNSTTETYVALHTCVDNWRWSGVPIIIQTGKKLWRKLTNVEIEFNQPPLCLFREFAECPPNPNWLEVRIQPNEGMSLSFAAKQPGPKYAMQDVKMDFSYRGSFEQRSPEAYERLLLEALRGDTSLFTRSDEVESAWKFVSAIIEAWSKLPPAVFPNYEPATHGPEEANRLLNPIQTRRQ
jgi:glucose-6-phosphate 1-dehydrogenase